MKKIISLVISAFMAVSLSACGEKSSSDPYPNQPVQVIIPYAPGGGSDILTRTIMEYIELPNDQPLVAVNIEGAAGMVGAMEAYNSKNDGYKILAHNAMDVASYSLSQQSDVELWSELETICDVVVDYNVISTNTSTGWSSIEEVIEYAKANPGEIKWGVTGAKTVNMADTIRMVEALGLTDLVTIVPYDGGAASRTALMGNHIQIDTNSSSDVRSYVESGDVVPLMVIGSERAKALAEVATSTEKGYNITTTKPRGYYAPKGTPQEVIDALATAIEKVTQNPSFIEKVEGLGLEPKFVKGEDSKAQVADWMEDLEPVFNEHLID